MQYVIIIIVVAIITISARRQRYIEEIGKKLDMETIGDGILEKPRLHGTVDGRDIIVEQNRHIKIPYHFLSGIQLSRVNWFVTYKVTLKSTSTIHDTLFTRISVLGTGVPLFTPEETEEGLTMIEFEDETFDSKTAVRTRNEKFARAILTPEMQESILELGTGAFLFAENEIVFEALGRADRNESNIRQVMNLLRYMENRANNAVVELDIPRFMREPEYDYSEEYYPFRMNQPYWERKSIRDLERKMVYPDSDVEIDFLQGEAPDTSLEDEANRN